MLIVKSGSVNIIFVATMERKQTAIRKHWFGIVCLRIRFALGHRRREWTSIEVLAVAETVNTRFLVEKLSIDLSEAGMENSHV